MCSNWSHDHCTCHIIHVIHVSVARSPSAKTVVVCLATNMVSSLSLMLVNVSLISSCGVIVFVLVNDNSVSVMCITLFPLSLVVSMWSVF